MSGSSTRTSCREKTKQSSMTPSGDGTSRVTRATCQREAAFQYARPLAIRDITYDSGPQTQRDFDIARQREERQPIARP